MTEKVDITSKVIGKVKGDGFELFLNGSKIGEVTFRNNQKEYILLQGFLSEDQRIFQLKPKQEPVTQYVEGCEMGWC
ncbi:DUF2553 family protein [Pontibacillus sp. HMF3514]|uniref:DUF2553 family protein n=1 Tax=Pontibacillus sp. HMF3514 TaxID=2692425 RepID=UPI00131FDF44|nr:DUF2553 family protein [Pontibacillus sp. HMF3514]QHE51272.1 DUF2553 family protein [Pontibacillus sp. HMF3514]